MSRPPAPRRSRERAQKFIPFRSRSTPRPDKYRAMGQVNELFARSHSLLSKKLLLVCFSVDESQKANASRRALIYLVRAPPPSLPHVLGARKFSLALINIGRVAEGGQKKRKLLTRTFSVE